MHKPEFGEIGIKTTVEIESDVGGNPLESDLLRRPASLFTPYRDIDICTGIGVAEINGIR